MEGDTDPVATSASAPTPDPLTARPPRKLANLRALLERTNVMLLLVAPQAKNLEIVAEFAGIKGKVPHNFNLGENAGCFVVLYLTDNPEGLEPGRFYELGLRDEVEHKNA